MAGEIAWISHYDDDYLQKETEDFDLDLVEEIDKEVNAVSVDVILPDDLLERILSYLPLASIFRASCVCKRWNATAERFLWNPSYLLPQKPWYFMFTSSDEPTGHAYDPNLRKCRTKLFVCNPITKGCRKLLRPPGMSSDYGALAISVDKESHGYIVAVVKSKQVPENVFQWDISIHIYNSKEEAWATPLTEVLTGWRGGDESVMCNGMLYFVVYYTGGVLPENRHALVAYNISSRSSQASLGFIPIPCSLTLTCARLMNMKEKLVMVGGIGKHDRPDIIKGIGIWVLHDRKWEEIVRMPNKYFQGFGEFDDVFASSGVDDLIYIQSYGSPALLTFDMNIKQWKWSQKCPVTKRFPLQLFTGFCFEPRLEISP
ncbi:unnamed protein product [Vicia faba]|uniref:F-box domain-containing protein n=1 Tax=Vicia faba TaxID=3906 RepID=A0AAV1AH83_VICFA|nr:unnamed protein product [Vicia faba]